MGIGKSLLATIAIPLVAMLATVAPVAAVPSFCQGFETDTSGWNDDTGTIA
jgi:hypothetical protein